MDRIPPSYKLKNKEIDVDSQVNRLRKALKRNTQCFKDYHRQYFLVMEQLIAEKVIIFHDTHYEMIGSHTFICLEFAIRIRGDLDQVLYIPLFIQLRPVNFARERPPIVRCVFENNYADANSSEIINSSRILSEWKRGDPRNVCGLKPLILDLKSVFSKTCPIRHRGSAEINEFDIKDVKAINLDPQNFVQGGRSFSVGTYGYRDPIPVFIKTIQQTKEERKAIVREYLNHSKLSNPNIIQFVGYYFKGNTISIVTKLADCSLSHYLSGHPELSIERKKYILYSVAYGLVYLKWNNVSHHDLKLQNILIDGDYVKLCDFGSSCRYTDTVTITTSIIDNGNALHRSPSLQHGMSEKELKQALAVEDVYAFGVIIMEVILGDKRVIDHVNKTDPQLRRGVSPHPALEKDTILNSIVTDCLKDYRKRPSIYSIAQRIYDWNPDPTLDWSTDY